MSGEDPLRLGAYFPGHLGRNAGQLSLSAGNRLCCFGAGMVFAQVRVKIQDAQ